jgi:pimeloyl-ACP methyl ester carboxylesterase
LRQIWVLDSTPEPGRTGAGADRLLALLRRLPDRFDDRRDATSAIRAAGFDPVIAEWAATNLEHRADGYRWQLDFAGLELLLADFYRENLWALVEHPPRGVELVFVRSSRGSIVEDAVAERIARIEANGQSVRLLGLEGGHWINMSNPDGLLALLVSGLPA